MSRLSDSEVERLARLLEHPEIPGGRYRLLEPIGRGGMGTVYLARDEPLDREVAIKVMRPFRDAAALVARVEREARTIARLDHASVVPIHEIGFLDDGRPWYAMKHVRGSTLRDWRNGGATTQESLRAFLRCCEAVAHAHSLGIVHRDLKPENVMVGPHGELYVMDWGLAKHLDGPDEPVTGTTEGARDPETGHGAVLGTPAYMAPEQARGESRTAGRGADVFALGGILCFLWTGSDPPTDGEVALAGAPRALKAIARKARAANVEARYASAADLAQDVANHLDRQPVSAHREGPVERLGRFLDRNRFVAWLVVGYLVLRVLVFLFARR